VKATLRAESLVLSGVSGAVEKAGKSEQGSSTPVAAKENK
jgi:hypothetical protein